MVQQQTYRLRIIVLSALVSVISFNQVFAQDHPKYKLLRHEESWGQQKGIQNQSFPDAIKFIPLTKNEQGFLTLGGELRSYFKFYDNEQLGALGQDEYLLQRFMTHAAISTHSTDSSLKMRAFFQLKSGLVGGRNGPIYPVDKDKLDLNQAFFEIRFAPNEQSAITFRAGRQELRYGTGRMIEVREGPNVRFGFDALLGRYETSKWKIDAFGALPTATKPGIFDNNRLLDRPLWGIYADNPNFDWYYLGFKHPITTKAGKRYENRHTIGTRWHGSSSKFMYDTEVAFQFGSFDERSISAWNLNLRTAYSLSKKAGLGMDVIIASGDDHPTDNRLGTFKAPYPSGKYTSAGSIIGPFNLIKVQPFLKFSPLKKLHIIPSSYFFWRSSTDDHMYSMSGAPYRQDTSGKRYIGAMPEILLIWNANRHISAFLETAYFFDGPFLKHFENSSNMLYLGLRMGYKF